MQTHIFIIYLILYFYPMRINKELVLLLVSEKAIACQFSFLEVITGFGNISCSFVGKKGKDIT